MIYTYFGEDTYHKGVIMGGVASGALKSFAARHPRRKILPKLPWILTCTLLLSAALHQAYRFAIWSSSWQSKRISSERPREGGRYRREEGKVCDDKETV